jgi:hypothetical protein
MIASGPGVRIVSTMSKLAPYPFSGMRSYFVKVVRRNFARRWIFRNKLETRIWGVFPFALGGHIELYVVQNQTVRLVSPLQSSSRVPFPMTTGPGDLVRRR